MDLTGEAIEKICELTERARDAEAFEFSESNNRIQIRNTNDGTITWKDRPPTHIRASVLTISDLIAVLGHIDECQSIWVNSQSISGVIGEHRDGLVRLPLKLNPAFSVLQNMKDLEPKAMIRRLRVDLFQCMFNIDLKAALAYLKFETNSTSESATVKNDVSIAKSVRSKVTNETEIPDDVTLTFGAFPELSEECETSVSVCCAVIVEPDKGTVSLIPYPGEIDSAINDAVGRLADCVRALAGSTRALAGSTPVYCGHI